MRFEITFHGPFRVETGSTRAGVAATVNWDDLLPASSLKGLMRASARQLLSGHPALIDEVFGGSGSSGRHHASPWHWDSARFGDEQVRRDQRARVSIDPDTGAGRPGFLFLGEEVWVDGPASFEVIQHRPLDPAVRARHQAVLAAAAAGVHALGSDRRRGLGWVTVRPVDPPLDDDLLAAFEALAGVATTVQGGPDA